MSAVPGRRANRELPTVDTLRPVLASGADDDVALFLWLVDQIERFEARPDAAVVPPADVARQRVRGLRRAAAKLDGD